MMQDQACFNELSADGGDVGGDDVPSNHLLLSLDLPAGCSRIPFSTSCREVVWALGHHHRGSGQS